MTRHDTENDSADGQTPSNTLTDRFDTGTAESPDDAFAALCADDSPREAKKAHLTTDPKEVRAACTFHDERNGHALADCVVRVEDSGGYEVETFDPAGVDLLLDTCGDFTVCSDAARGFEVGGSGGFVSTLETDATHGWWPGAGDITVTLEPRGGD